MVLYGIYYSFLISFISSFRLRNMLLLTVVLIFAGLMRFMSMKNLAVSAVIPKINNNLVIGILAQESYSVDQFFPPGMYHSFIAASYVKYAESGGARVVPIMIGKEQSYYEDITNRVNGIIFPGGATWFNESNGYADAGIALFKLAKVKQVPILGICLGMELLTYADSNANEHRIHCNSFRQALPLEFEKDFRQSTMFKNAPSDLITIMKTEPVTINFHRFCVTVQNLTELGINDGWHILSQNHDVDGLEFISSLESRHYPFFGVQFHPEKNIYEWKSGQNIPHTRNAIRVSNYFLEVFINATRLNYNEFPEDILSTMLIYNYQTSYTGSKGSSYAELYMFA